MPGKTLCVVIGSSVILHTLRSAESNLTRATAPVDRPRRAGDLAGRLKAARYRAAQRARRADHHDNFASKVGHCSNSNHRSRPRQATPSRAALLFRITWTGKRINTVEKRPLLRKACMKYLCSSQGRMRRGMPPPR
jgi:hypothetical protein